VIRAKCPGGCTHSSAEHRAFDTGIDAGLRGDERKPPPQPNGYTVGLWCDGYAVGEARREGDTSRRAADDQPPWGARYRARFASEPKLHGSVPPADAVRLYTLAELPPWVKPQRRVESLTSYFYGRPGVDEIAQVVFAIDADGATFLDLVRHTPKMAKPLFAGDVTPLPGCVLVAVGVEQLRRARAGR